MNAADSIGAIKGIGPATEQLFRKLGIATIQDLIDYYPRGYTDYSHITDIADIDPGLITIKAKIVKVSGRYVRRGMHITAQKRIYILSEQSIKFINHKLHL